MLIPASTAPTNQADMIIPSSQPSKFHLATSRIVTKTNASAAIAGASWAIVFELLRPGFPQATDVTFFVDNMSRTEQLSIEHVMRLVTNCSSEHKQKLSVTLQDDCERLCVLHFNCMRSAPCSCPVYLRRNPHRAFR